MDELVASIKAIGVIQAPTVRKNGKGYDVLWGNRRVLAAKKAGLESLDCVVVELKDDAARTAAIAENIVRAPMDPMDQFESFNKMHEDGQSVIHIAGMFGISEHLVRQRMRLADLSPHAKKAYHKGEIDIEACMALTLGSHKEQHKLLSNGTLQAWGIQRALRDTKIPMANALFDPKLYTGAMTTDLFDHDDDVANYCLDSEEFMTLQTEAIATDMNKKAKLGWLFVETTHITPYDFKKLEDGRKVERSYINIENIKKAERKKYGLIYHTNMQTCEVDVRVWVVLPEKPAKGKKKVAGKEVADTASLTANQNKELAGFTKLLFVEKANLNDALMIFMVKHGAGPNGSGQKFFKADTKELTEAFIAYMVNYASTTWPDSDLVKLGKSHRWDIREIWTPDETFLKGYSQDQLVAIGKKVKSPVDACKTKSEKVAQLLTHFASNKNDARQKWTP
jgi:ParB/RepB/Spo0J family partition protein